MDMEELLAQATALDGVLALRPAPGDGSPEIAWGDAFFYFAPDGRVPATQPFATVVTKDYPDEPASGLDADGSFRLNIAVPAAEFVRLIGMTAREAARGDHDVRARDTWFPHPVYGGAGWVSVIDPDAQAPEAVRLLGLAHAAAKARQERRAAGERGDRA